MSRLEQIEWKPGRRITRVAGEWVVVDAEGKVIARDLHLREEDVERLVAAVKKDLGV